MKKVFLIVADQILENDKLSFSFMFDSKASYPDFADISSHWGLIILKDKPDDFVNPFRLSRHEANAVGPDGVKIWTLCIMKSNQGLVLSATVDETEDNEGLKSTLTECPDCVLLADRATVDPFIAVCLAAGIETKCHYFDGILATSKPPRP